MGTRTITQLLYSAVGAAAVSACSVAPTAMSPTQETSSMPTSSHADSQSQNPTAEFLLLRVIKLIEQSESVQDLTPDRVSAAMQQPATFFSPDRFGYRGALTSDWDYTLEIEDTKSNGRRMDLEFVDATPGRTASAREICQFDFDEFSSRLERIGFARTTIHGEHGIVVFDRFDRPELSILVSSIGESRLTPEKTRYRCVRLVTVQAGSIPGNSRHEPIDIPYENRPLQGAFRSWWRIRANTCRPASTTERYRSWSERCTRYGNLPPSEQANGAAWESLSPYLASRRRVRSL